MKNVPNQTPQIQSKSEVSFIAKKPSITKLRHREFEADLTTGEIKIVLDEVTRDALRKIATYFYAKYAEEFCKNGDEECTEKIERLVAEAVAGTVMHLLRTWIQTIGYYVI